MQRERLQDEFAATLNMFQAAQRSTAQKEKEQVNKAKAQAYGEPFLSSYKKDEQLIELQDSSAARQQVQLQEESELRALQEQEQSIRQLEVGFYSSSQNNFKKNFRVILTTSIKFLKNWGLWFMIREKLLTALRPAWKELLIL